MTTITFLKKVAHMRALQKKYFELRKQGRVTEANAVLRECKAAERQVDDELTTVIIKEETPKMF